MAYLLNMGKLETSDYYDSIYLTSGEYRLHYRDSRYYVLWTQILQFIKRIENPKILEIGCGAGQFANYLYDEGYRNYSGFDFSPQAVRMAKEAVDFPFTVGDAMNPECLDVNAESIRRPETPADLAAYVRTVSEEFTVIPREFAIEMAPFWIWKGRDPSFDDYADSSPIKTFKQSLSFSTAARQ